MASATNRNRPTKTQQASHRSLEGTCAPSATDRQLCTNHSTSSARHNWQTALPVRRLRDVPTRHRQTISYTPYLFAVREVCPTIIDGPIYSSGITHVPDGHTNVSKLSSTLTIPRLYQKSCQTLLSPQTNKQRQNTYFSSTIRNISHVAQVINNTKTCLPWYNIASFKPVRGSDLRRNPGVFQE